MCVYDTENGYGAAELFSTGAALDDLSGTAEILERECTVGTAESYGLSKYLSILPLRPVERNTETKRMAVAALLSVDDASFTESALNGILCGCGIPARLTETDTANTVEVTFPGTRGTPEDIDEIKAGIESLLPCHLDITYRIVYITWDEVEEEFSTWAELEAAELSWDEFERYGSL